MHFLTSKRFFQIVSIQNLDYSRNGVYVYISCWSSFGCSLIGKKINLEQCVLANRDKIKHHNSICSKLTRAWNLHF